METTSCSEPRPQQVLFVEERDSSVEQVRLRREHIRALHGRNRVTALGDVEFEFPVGDLGPREIEQLLTPEGVEELAPHGHHDKALLVIVAPLLGPEPCLRLREGRKASPPIQHRPA